MPGQGWRSVGYLLGGVDGPVWTVRAPELNPTENLWSNLRRGLTNLAAGTVTDLACTAKNRLKRMQYRPGLVDGFLAATGLSPP